MPQLADVAISGEFRVAVHCVHSRGVRSCVSLPSNGPGIPAEREAFPEAQNNGVKSMSAETIPNSTATATTTDRSTELVNRLLKLPEQVKLDLANLLLDSVRQGFTSLAEAEKRDKELIRSRVEQVVRGEVPLLDWREALEQTEKRFREKFPQ